MEISIKDYSNQFIPKKIDHIVYVFDKNSSFYPSDIPIKYGFQIRSLIKHNRLSSWKFSEQDENQIIYQSSINHQYSKHINVPFVHYSSISSISKHSPSILAEIQNRWTNFLLNNRLSKGQDDRQLSSVVHQSSHSSFIQSTIATTNISSQGLYLLKNSANQSRTNVKRRAKYTTFEEHLQHYYRFPLCLSSTRNFHDQYINSYLNK